MNAVIIYEESDSASKANELLRRASDRAGAATQWSVKPWRLDMLDSPALAEEAQRDATRAQLIVLACRGQGEAFSRLLNWLEAWAERRQVQDAALAVFDGDQAGTLSASTTPALGEFAQRHGLSFILGDVDQDLEQPQQWEGPRELDIAETAILAEELLEQAPPWYYRHWGINE
jgi:hypothetical protein